MVDGGRSAKQGEGGEEVTLVCEREATGTLY